MKPFDAQNIELKGKNLIEASAGTGKTYSIGVLVLRMLLEKDIRTEQILMVTFTNAAVAELEIRIRTFLRTAYKIAQGFEEKKISNDEIVKTDQIYAIVSRAIEQKGKKEVIKLLKNAILFLDETSIFTIHGFSQFALSEFAFETGQLFNTEIIEDQTKIIESVVNDFWRKNISILDIELLEVLYNTGFTRKELLDFAKDITDGKKLYVKKRIDAEKRPGLIKEKQFEVENVHTGFADLVKENWHRIKNITTRSRNMNIIISNDDQQGFIEKYIADYEKYLKTGKQQYVQKYDFLIGNVTNILNAVSSFNNLKMEITVNYFEDAAIYLEKEIEKRKNRNRMLSFYDLISQLHQAIVIKDKKRIQDKLRDKYKCVFIDEFQDTDHLQYDIFRKVFVEKGNTTVFFIGDPKQSIYGWRGADINTYIEAKNDIEHQYTMKNNYRSTAPLVSAMNDFFPGGICEDGNIPDPFCSKDILYEPVEAANSELAVLHEGDNPASSFDIIEFQPGFNNQNILYENTVKEVLNLLQTGFFIKNNKKSRVKPENIGILVRANREAKIIKKLLLKYNVPAIITDETKVMQTGEAVDLYYVIYAIINTDNSSISRALFTSFTGFTTEKIANSDMDYHKSVFLQLKKIWKLSGIYSAILSFTGQYGIRRYLLDHNTENGNRIYTNLMQLTDILNEKETIDNFGPEKLTDWLKKSIEGLDSSGKYQQLLESDEKALTITTIHKSKGLSYDIVLLPQANFSIGSESKLKKISFLENGKFYISYYLDEDEIKRYRLQTEQENRRLLYVAITRAVYKCIINYNNRPGTLSAFVPNLNTTKNSNVAYREPANIEFYRYDSGQDNLKIEKKPLLFSGKIEDKWQLTSYSRLDTHKIIPVWEKDIDKEDASGYDRFVFKELPKGTQSGLIIHSIFENLDFNSKTNWKFTVEKTLKYYGRTSTSEDIKNYIEMLNNVLDTGLVPHDFKLNEVESTKRFNELEFFFSFNDWKGKKIKEILPEVSISDIRIKGIMHGYIDLLFEYQGKYYILDWKTNYLGNSLEKYTYSGIEKAMLENNYHLQYYIYTIAAKRFLENRLLQFEYEKHFGGIYYLFIRSMRKGKNTGTYHKKPGIKKIMELEKVLNLH